MTFGEMMRSLREKAGLTQAQLADRSGVSLRTIQGWEQGYRCPVSSDFFNLASALGVSADTFASAFAVEGKQPPAKQRRKGR